jgi:hypothetical protein
MPFQPRQTHWASARGRADRHPCLPQVVRCQSMSRVPHRDRINPDQEVISRAARLRDHRENVRIGLDCRNLFE